MNSQRFSVAPMMDWTNRHCRMFHRMLNKDITLYTEMVTTGALLYGDTQRFLEFNAEEQPVVLQIGGSDPSDLAKAAKLAAEYGYKEINLNCGCPSERVQKGSFGACLMREPELVADCIKSMVDAVSLPITLKCRIGIDDSDEYAFLEDFVGGNKAAGCTTFIIHARKAWLKGLSPKDNREIPPLNYDRVYRLKADHPDLNIHINGGIKTIEEIETHLEHVDGVMIGREAYQNPWFLRKIDTYFGEALSSSLSERDVIDRMMQYAETQMAKGARLHDITRHMHGLFQGQPGAKAWRRHLANVSKESDNQINYICNFFN